MKIIREFADFGKPLVLPKGITLTNPERIKIANTINNALVSIYPFDRHSLIPQIFKGKKIVPQYIFKAVNNRTLLKKFIYDEYNQIQSGIKTKEDLFNFVQNNINDLFSPDGKWFDAVYNTLVATSKKGESIEDKCFKTFIEMASEKGMNIKILPPTNEEDMYGGIDGIFYIKGKRFTIQVKPLFKMEEYKKDSTKYIVFCDGVLKGLKTDYLIVANKDEMYIFRCKGIECSPTYFIVPKENLVK